MSDEFYWMNLGNMSEFDGPFPTVEEAKRRCVMSYKMMGDIASQVVITKLVLVGSVECKPDFKWGGDGAALTN